MTAHLAHASKFLSLILRHAPEKIGLALDAQGWADIGQLLAAYPVHHWMTWWRATARRATPSVPACIVFP
jgi:RNA:NAD 2'-phosphotransferase (TPT1/KptA family)